MSSVVAADTPDFNRDIRPILSKNCFGCHGPDAKARKGDLLLDNAEGAYKDRGGNKAVLAGQPDKSSLVERIQSTDPDVMMPPPSTGHVLTAKQRKMLIDWVKAGAKYDVHWAFKLPVKSQLPQVKKRTWPTSPVDYFVLARMEAAGLAPAQPATRYRLIRRLSLDLTGVPPTPEVADAFVRDRRPDAVEKVVDRLLSSEAFGEHWTRMWLDLARYADTKGYEKDRPRVIWRYRDWVIDALNADMTYDEFTVQQLAGDLLKDAKPNQLLATAFHRNTMTNDEGGTDNEEFRVAAVKDRVDTTFQVWMGLTIGCAKCHSHKYDPISQTDYYSIYAYFNQTADADRGDDAPTVATPTTADLQAERELTNQLKALEGQLKALKKDPKKEKSLKEKIKATEEQRKKLRGGFVKTPIMRDLADGKRRKTQIHVRGNFLNKGDMVKPAVLEMFGAFPDEQAANRLGVARWIMSDQNPLTARVMVNRVWARLFGVGLTETEEDFGTQGMLPSHPALLDWLAVEFRESGWSLKQLLRTLVLSSTYQQSTKSSEKLEKDPRNRLLSRGARFRLSGEAVRDQALAAAGLLTRSIGGPSVMPPQPAGVWKSTYNASKWKNAVGADRYRRALYTFWKRTSPYPAMMTFDAGSGEVCQIRRVRTNTPLQALVTLNDPAFVEAAGGLAERMQSASPKVQRMLDRGFRLVLIRPPTQKEQQALRHLYIELNRDFQEHPQAAQDLVKAAGLRRGDAALVAVANVLLNLDETLMKP